MMGGQLTAIKVPKWGLAMEEGTVVKWHVSVGDAVRAGDEIVDIESSKIANVVECPDNGVLLRIVGGEGQLLPVGSLIGVIGEEGTPPADVDQFIEAFQNTAAEDLDPDNAQILPTPDSIDLLGARIQYLEMGPQDFEGDVPAILIHGFGGDLNNWLFNQSDLAADRKVFALDLPGHGGSVKDPAFADLDKFVELVEAFAKAKDLDLINVVGHSLGGAIALRLAERCPELVNAVVTVCGAGQGSEVSPEYVTGFLSASRRRELKQALEMLFADSSLVSTDMVQDLLRFKRLDGVAETLAAISENVLAPDRLPDFSASFEASDLPILTIWGEKDGVITPPPSSLSAPHLERRDIKGVGHMAHMEAASAVNEMIRGFFAAAD